jgi:hypothetical protein
MTHDQFIDRLALEVADSMDHMSLWSFAVQVLGDEYSRLSNDELAATVASHAPQLLNDLMELPK